MFIEAKYDGGGGDNWTTGAISRAKLQSYHHHQQTNIQYFTGRMPFLSPNQRCQSTEGNGLLMDCATQTWWKLRLHKCCIMRTAQHVDVAVYTVITLAVWWVQRLEYS